MQQHSKVEIQHVAHAPNRPTKAWDKSAFGLASSGDSSSSAFNAFVEPGPLTPELDPDYIFDKTLLINFLLAMKCGDNIYCVGESGTGKTTFVKQVAARLGYNVVQVNFDGNIRSSDLIGSVRVRDGATFFQHGIIPYAYTMPGTILILDEVDACPAEAAFALQRGLSEERKILIRETGEQITIHPQNIIVATANTKGAGDDSGNYAAGTNIQNFSFLNRFASTLVFKYLTVEQELLLLMKKFPTLERTEKDTRLLYNICVVMAEIRNGFLSGKFSAPLTTRDSIAWANKLQYIARPLATAEMAFLNRMPNDEAMAAAMVIKARFPEMQGDSSRFIRSGKS